MLLVYGRQRENRTNYLKDSWTADSENLPLIPSSGLPPLHSGSHPERRLNMGGTLTAFEEELPALYGWPQSCGNDVSRFAVGIGHTGVMLKRVRTALAVLLIATLVEIA